MARIQPIWLQITVIGSRSIIASRVISSASPASLKVLRRAPSLVFLPKALRTSSKSRPICFHCLASDSRKATSPARSFCKASRSAINSISSKRRKLRRRMFRMDSA